MSIGAVIACTEQALGAQLRELLLEIPDVEVLAVAENSAELVTAVLEREPTIVIVHDALGTDSVHPVVRDLSLRRPASVVIMVTDGSAGAITAAMNAGARSVLELPLAFDDVRRSVQGAIDWSEQMEQILAGSEVSETGGFRARVLTVTGAKGGVGTTTVATHLCWQHMQNKKDRTLLIDLDLEKGDVSSFVEVKYRISIADLAKVAGDLSVRTVLDGTLEHESGIFLLLPPEDVRDVEWVTPQAFREILNLLRGEFDNIVIDAGAHLTPLQAAAVEVADGVVTVTTPDLVSIRGARRSISAWESLGARKASDVNILVNRQARDRELQPRSIAQLIVSPLLETSLPESTRTLEASVNSRSPGLVSHAPWWRTIRALSDELGLDEPELKAPRTKRAHQPKAAPQDEQALEVPDPVQPPIGAGGPPQGQPLAVAGNPVASTQYDPHYQGQPPLPPAPTGSPVSSAVPVPPAPTMPPMPVGTPPQRRSDVRRRRDGESGSASIELLGALPIILVIVVLVWQMLLAGVTWIWTGQAAADAAREVSLGSSTSQVRAAVHDRLPAGMTPGSRVAVASGDKVTVSVKVPLVAPGVANLPWRIEVERKVVSEP